MLELSFDASSMDALTRDLRESADRVSVEVDRCLAEVGELVAETAKTVARDAGSSSIPPTIRSHPLPGLVEITAGSSSVPLAALWDLGNKRKGRGSSKRTSRFYTQHGQQSQLSFRHPVYGNQDAWVDQPRHLILGRARTLTRKEVTVRMNRTWNRALEPLTHLE